MSQRRASARTAAGSGSNIDTQFEADIDSSMLTPARKPLVHPTPTERLRRLSQTASAAVSPSKVAKSSKSIWNRYLGLLETHPVTTKSTTAAVLSAVSDLIAQLIMGATLLTVNTTSLFHQFLCGLLLRGPWVHGWYLLLTRMLDVCGYKRSEQSKWSAVILKTMVDQLTFSPFFTWLYFYVIAMLEGRSFTSAQSDIDKHFWNIMFANWKVWPIIGAVNFKYVPPKLQVAFGNVVAVVWTVYFFLATKQ